MMRAKAPLNRQIWTAEFREFPNILSNRVARDGARATLRKPLPREMTRVGALVSVMDSGGQIQGSGRPVGRASDLERRPKH